MMIITIITILIVCEGVSQRQTARPQSKVSEEPLYIRAITATIQNHHSHQMYDIWPSEPLYIRALTATIYIYMIYRHQSHHIEPSEPPYINNMYGHHIHQRHFHQRHCHQYCEQTTNIFRNYYTFNDLYIVVLQVLKYMIIFG